MDVDDVDNHPHHAHHGHLALPLHPACLASAGAGHAFPKVNAGAGAATAAAGAVVATGAAGAPGGPPATSVHELLECPVCTNSMFPPIHQTQMRSLAPFGSDLLADSILEDNMT